jgi:hypothetical protein
MTLDEADGHAVFVRTGLGGLELDFVTQAEKLNYIHCGA